jgi:hypothetical protein
MGDLPRWIDDAIVDSVAMTTAYTEWVRRTNAPALLWEEQHVPYVGVMDYAKPASGVELPWKPCRTPSCVRCSSSQGGFKFKWYSSLWRDRYIALCRPGAWSPLASSSVAISTIEPS